MRRILFLFLLIPFIGMAQSETNDMITYDTAIAYSPAYAGAGGNSWGIRITRPRNLFTAGNPDTASRPWIMTIPGAGQVGTDTNFLTAFGPHYWMLNGWNGAVQLGNGTHYPFYFTIIQSGANTRPWFLQALIDTLLSHYHCLHNKINTAGFSMGGWTWGRYITYSSNGTETHCMSLVQSFVGLEGVAADNFNGVSFGNGGAGKWALLYNGKYFGWEGNHDNRGMYVWRDTMSNVGFRGNAFFSYQDLGTDGLPHFDGSNGGGSHCCWNSWYDPNFNNYLTNPSVVAQTNHLNSPGTYYELANIYQWMIRQGDTTLISSCFPSVDAGTNRFVQLPSNSITITGTATPSCGRSISTISWTQISGPGTATITGSGGLTPNFMGLVAGTYVFQISATDNAGSTSSDNVNVIVQPTVSPNVSAGPNQTIILPINSGTLSGTSSGNGGATIVTKVWTQVSGPNTATFSATNADTVNISNLITGSYIFKYTVTDNNGNSNSATTSVFSTPQIISNAAPIQVGAGEYVTYFIDPAGKLWGQGGNNTLIGNGNTGTPGIAYAVTGIPAGLKFRYIVGGLHGGLAVDTAGNAWTIGDNGQGQAGIGNNSVTYIANQVTVDSAGNPFTNIVAASAFFAGNYAGGWLTIKSDGTLWTWGCTLYGIRGNGTDSIHADSLTYRPVQIPLPAGRKAVQVIAGAVAIVLLDDSTVGTWGKVSNSNLGYTTTTSKDYQSIHILSGLNSVVEIEGGNAWNFALKRNGELWGWGFNGNYLGGWGGFATGGGAQVPTPRNLVDSVTNYLPAPISELTCNQSGTLFLLKNGQLWGCGDNAQGGIGQGYELNYALTANPYSWDFLPGDLPIKHPVRITGKSNFVGAFSSSTFCFYFFAETADSVLYSWGRNKAVVLGNGINNCSGNQAALRPNSLDVTWPTIVSPLTVSTVLKVSSPLCVTTPGTSECSDAGCSIPSLTTTCNAGSTQNISTATTTLSGSSTTTGTIIKYAWKQISGPNTALFDLNSSPTAHLSGLGTGSYIFQLAATDNAWNTITSNVTVNVNNVTNCNCIVLPGGGVISNH